ASQCHLSKPISATYQCCQSVPPISASQCHLSVRISATYQCASVPPISAVSVPPNSASHQCRLSVPYISAMYQCCLSVPISDACQCPSV
ncbi:unnamed protein product, partial [Staurois parvus]